jgi:hypothetical protein
MITQEIAEAFLSDLRDLCKKHNVRVTAVCHSESVFGELIIEEAHTDSLWQIQDVSYHEVFQHEDREGTKTFYIQGAW